MESDESNELRLRKKWPLIDNGYKYYYQGSKPVFDTQIGDKNSLLNSNRFEILFENGNSAIYKLIKCD